MGAKVRREQVAVHLLAAFEHVRKGELTPTRRQIKLALVALKSMDDNTIAVRSLEKIAVVNALKEFRSRTMAATALGVSRAKLYRLMRKHQIEVHAHEPPN